MMAFICSVCGQEHEGLPALTFDKPLYWRRLSADEQARSRCDSDRCRTFDGHHFIRCVLVIPLSDGPEPTLEFGVWLNVSKEDFNRYNTTFADADQAKSEPMLGWLSNEIKAFPDSLVLKCRAWLQNGNKRPLLELEPTDHPLSVAQRNGIEFSKALEIVHTHAT